MISVWLLNWQQQGAIFYKKKIGKPLKPVEKS